METVAATPTGGAETSARPDVSAEKPTSVHDRLKAALFTPPEPEPDAGRSVAPVIKAETPAAPNEQVEGDDADEKPKPQPEGEPKEDAEEEAEQEQSFESFDELAEALGWDADKLSSLSAKTKIDGKEGKATLRDLIKSYQLEGHLNQKLMTHAEEKKAFETERQNFIQTSQQKLATMDAALQIATQFLKGEFAHVNWQQLSQENPEEFNRQYVLYQQRQATLNHIADNLGNERKTAEAQAAEQGKAYLAEQMKLLESKVPEWSTKDARDKALNDMGAVFAESYGITPQELGGVADHRMLLVARDAWQWQKLQKAKPAVVNKVKTAPKLLKPGAPQSRATQNDFIAQKERERLRSTGKVAHAKAPLKRLLFNS